MAVATRETRLHQEREQQEGENLEVSEEELPDLRDDMRAVEPAPKRGGGRRRGGEDPKRVIALVALLLQSNGQC